MTKKDIKLAIFDIDDTLIKRGKVELESSALSALKTLEEKGIEVMVATGRAYYFVHDDVKERLNPDYYVTTNGACVYYHGDLIYKVPMVREEVNAMITYARENNLGIALKQEAFMPVYNDLHVFQTTYMQGSSKQDILEDAAKWELLSNIDEVPMGIFLMGDESIIEASRPLCPSGTYAKAYTDAYDVYSKDAGKIKGIEHLLSQKGLTWDNVIAIGDAANDQEMVQKAAIGVAMGNATDSLKSVADYITTDIEDHGIHNALMYYELI